MKNIVIYTLIIGAVMCFPFRAANATIARITICNEGSIPVYIAYARPDGDDVHVKGWYTTKPGNCSLVIESRSTSYYFAFAVKDGYVNFGPQQLPSVILPANKTYCTHKKNTFSYYQDDSRKLLCKDGYELAPFWMQVLIKMPTSYYRGRENEVRQTITIKPGRDSFKIRSNMIPKMIAARRDYVNTIVKASKQRYAAISKVVWNSILNFDRKMLGNLIDDHNKNQGAANRVLQDTKIKAARPDMSKNQEEQYVNDILQRLKKDSGK